MSTAPPGRRKAVTPLRAVIGLCLAAPYVAILWVSSYSAQDPTLIGIPFFYWYQMLWVILASGLTGIAYKLWQRDQRTREGGADR
jgi:hypothetical protein